MLNRSSVLDDVMCALRGKPNAVAVVSAPHDRRLARVLAPAPNDAPIIRAVAALSEGLFDLLSDSIVSVPAPHDVLVRMIGTPEGQSVIWGWAKIASAGRGRAYAVALVDAVNNATCSACAAAALIGACDKVAARPATTDAMICTPSSGTMRARRSDCRGAGLSV